MARLEGDGGGGAKAAGAVAKAKALECTPAPVPLLGRYEIDDIKLLHRSASTAVAAATDRGDSEAKLVPRVALKAMCEVEQVCAELKGRVGLDPKYVVAIKAVYADEEAVDAGDWDMVVSAAAGLEGVLLQRVPNLCRSIQTSFSGKQEMERIGKEEANINILANDAQALTIIIRRSGWNG